MLLCCRALKLIANGLVMGSIQGASRDVCIESVVERQWDEEPQQGSDPEPGL